MRCVSITCLKNAIFFEKKVLKSLHNKIYFAYLCTNKKKQLKYIFMAKISKAKRLVSDLYFDLFLIANDNLTVFNPIGPDGEYLDFKTMDVIKQRLSSALANVNLKICGINDMLSN